MKELLKVLPRPPEVRATFLPAADRGWDGGEVQHFDTGFNLPPTNHTRPTLVQSLYNGHPGFWKVRLFYFVHIIYCLAKSAISLKN